MINSTFAASDRLIQSQIIVLPLKKTLRASGGLVVAGGNTDLHSPVTVILIPQEPNKIPHSQLQAGSCDLKLFVVTH